MDVDDDDDDAVDLIALDAFCQPQTKTFGIVCSTDEIGLLTLCIPITYIVIVDLLIVRVNIC